MSFAKDAALEDRGLLNSSLLGTRGARSTSEGYKVDEKALKALVRAAVSLN